jgi:flagellar biosynthesis/type III secretory pathway protein FliH
MLSAVTAAWRREIMESNMQTRTFLEELEARALEKGLEKGLKKGIKQGIEQGIEKGIEKGIEQGIGQGKEEGLRDSIQLVCQTRGLHLASSHIEQLNSCHNQGILKRWLELAMSAASPEDIFR